MRSAVEAVTGRTVRSLQPIAGGDINEAYKVQFEDESFGFVKTRAHPQPGEYAAEAAGLRWLAEPGALRVPDVLGVADDVLVLDWVDEGGRGDAAALGAGLAEVHAAGADDWGATPLGDMTKVGRLELSNEPCADWPTFYATRRVLPLLPQAGLSAAGTRAVEAVCDRIADLAGPAEPPSRIHGDLWSGNVHWDRAGRAWLIDPAAYGGHREVDLAMLQLFGAPGAAFFAAYEERHPLATGWRDRVALYQLFPLLVHAALFGGGYAASAERAARTYV
ncbi:fructosamine-3-kinase [Solirubrobacter pauli]|uniref:Fructosamine-3-kinase n=1 Tax=Solirubrobacter pauli TaxID=166793 RepID=A0A660L8R1_9ACTN|nr:fructosamine kinase family protein [Solirubrobacter pauli]RKQ91412.1 fructosamine-3-kinase [Solirubrobacter pauli]